MVKRCSKYNLYKFAVRTFIHIIIKIMVIINDKFLKYNTIYCSKKSEINLNWK